MRRIQFLTAGLILLALPALGQTPNDEAKVYLGAEWRDYPNDCLQALMFALQMGNPDYAVTVLEQHQTAPHVKQVYEDAAKQDGFWNLVATAPAAAPAPPAPPPPPVDTEAACAAAKAQITTLYSQDIPKLRKVQALYKKQRYPLALYLLLNSLRPTDPAYASSLSNYRACYAYDVKPGLVGLPRLFGYVEGIFTK